MLPNDQAIDTAISITADLVKTLNIPALAAFGISQEHVPEMIALARKASSMRYNPVVLSDDELGAVLLAGIHGG